MKLAAHCLVALLSYRYGGVFVM
eukprot:COSAG03_NODE_15397_length_432_cov_0.672673_2_plen_22_part_01